MKMNIISKFSIIALMSILAVSCNTKNDDEDKTITKYIGCTQNVQNQGDCIRWMDRTIYLAYAAPGTNNRNSELQKQKVKEALCEIQNGTMLGGGPISECIANPNVQGNYFNFVTVDESLLQPIIEPGLSPNQYRSFILIWPDNIFNDYVVNVLGGNTPDPNAITIINSAYKRKFFMIFRASCFESSAQCNNITTPGLYALIARQFGLLSGIAPVNCDIDETNVMCASYPTDAQWDEANKQRWMATENNILEVILNNPNFYDEYVPGT